jgi:ribonuclease E
VTETVVESAVVLQGGVACPELAMGKVIVRRDSDEQHTSDTLQKNDAAVEVIEQVTVPVDVKETVIEAEEIFVAANEPASQEDVEVVSESAQETAEQVSVAVEETVDETNAEVTTQETTSSQVESKEDSAENLVKVEALVQATQPKLEKRAVSALSKPHAFAPMTKAPGPQELREITVVAAAFRSERYVQRGAGSQVATSQASAEMAKPQLTN